MHVLRRTVVLSCVVMAGCADRAPASEKELADMRAELADMRSELRGMRQDLRALRGEEAPPVDVPPPPPEATAPDAAQPAAADAKQPPAAAPAKPPPQGTINLQIDSNPSGAVVFVAGKKVGMTPIIVKTPTGSEEVQVRLEKPGFRPRLMNVRPEEDTKLSVQLAKK